MTPTPRRLAGSLAVAACLVTACSTTSVGPTTTQVQATTTTVVGASTPADTGASTLRAQLTAWMTAQVYLTAVATSAVVSGSDPAPAVAALGNETQLMAAKIGEVWGGAAQTKFDSLTTTEGQLFVDYARAKVAGDTTASDKAKADLATFEDDMAAFLAANNLYLTKVTVAPDLKTDVDGVVALIDAQASRAPTQYSLLAVAAGNLPHTATLVADGIAKEFPDKYPGTATGTAANLRASLTAALVSHVYLVAITTATVVGSGDTASPEASLDTNSHALANVVTVSYGDAAGQQFYSLWVGQVGSYIGYAKAAVSSDSAGQSKARSDLATFAHDTAAFLAAANPQLTAATVGSDLSDHVETQLAVTDAQEAKSTTQFDLLRQAADEIPPAADLLSEAIAVQFPLKYLP
jgi:hypothetical protein